MQKPLKEKYRSDPEAAVVTLSAQGRVGEGLTCKVETGKALVAAGLQSASSSMSPEQAEAPLPPVAGSPPEQPAADQGRLSGYRCSTS